MGQSLDTVMTILYVLIAVNVGFAAAIYMMKLKHIRRRHAVERFQRRYSDYLTYIHANVESADDLRPPPHRMHRSDIDALQAKLNDMIESFVGEPRRKLLRLCEQLGFIRYHLKRLHSRTTYGNKIDSVYHLGCMRVEAAVPAMLDLLRKHRNDPTMFIIARALAKCAKDDESIHEMVRILLDKGVEAPELMADMIEEADIDPTTIYLEYLDRDEAAYYMIGLAGLKDHIIPGMTEKVFPFLDAEQSSVRQDAVEIYLKSAAILPQDALLKLLNHECEHVRLATFRHLGQWRNRIPVRLLVNGLHDGSRQIVHACALEFMQMGEEGIQSLCQAAVHMDKDTSGAYLRAIIEEEIRMLSDRLHSVPDLVRYNTLKYEYEKAYGLNKQLHDAV